MGDAEKPTRHAKQSRRIMCWTVSNAAVRFKRIWIENLPASAAQRRSFHGVLSWKISYSVTLLLSYRLLSQCPAGSAVHRLKGWRAWPLWCVLWKKPPTPSPPPSRELFQRGSMGASWGMDLESLNLEKTGIEETIWKQNTAKFIHYSWKATEKHIQNINQSISVPYVRDNAWGLLPQSAELINSGLWTPWRALSYLCHGHLPKKDHSYFHAFYIQIFKQAVTWFHGDTLSWGQNTDIFVC